MQKYIPPHRRKAEVNSNKILPHAALRMNQREINFSTLNKLVEGGVSQRDHNSNTYRNKDSFCVLSSGGKVITVMDNYRNTNFDILNKTQDRKYQLLKKVKEKNDVAMCELAELYLDKNSSDFNPKKAHDLFLVAAKKHNNSHAMCRLASLYESNIIGAKNCRVYLEWMKKAANIGNKYAMAIIGQHLMKEYEALPNSNIEEKAEISSKAMRYFKKAEAKGSTRAMWHIAFIYQTGFFGEKNLTKAIEIFIKAAKRGSPNSLQSLQDIVCSGDIELDILEGILDSISPIISQQSSQLSLELGLKQIRGDLGIAGESSSNRGILMLEGAANNRNEEAIISLIKIYKEGTSFIFPDCQKVLFWAEKLKAIYEQAVSKGSHEAMFSLAELLLSGDLGKIDSTKAIKYFHDAISSGNAEYIYDFGMLLMEEESVIRDYEQGKKLINQAIEIWKKKVIEQKGVDAAFNIAEIYYYGDLGKRDYIRAAEWFTMSANFGDIYSKYYLAKINLVKLPERNAKLAIEYIKQILNEKTEDIDLVRKLPKLFLYLLEGNHNVEDLSFIQKVNDFGDNSNRETTELATLMLGNASSTDNS